MTVRTTSLNQSEREVDGEGIGIPMEVESLSDRRLFADDGETPSTSSAFDFTLLALSSINGLGRKGLIGLVDAFKGDLGKIWKAPAQKIHKALLDSKVPATDDILDVVLSNRDKLFEKAGTQLYSLLNQNVHIIPFKDLPRPLRTIPDPPRWLFVQGDPRVLYHKPAVAVVGTRNPSVGGRRATSYVVRLLSPYPITLVSGLAEGIDEEAHRSSLIEGITNIAFLGHGINFVFPAATGDLRKQIVERGGAVVTEYLPDDHYQKAFFVERNRLQAALANVVIPVEANPRGGTAHTIRFAQKYGREVIGIKWKGANGILEDLERSGAPIIDILSQEGSKKLDLLFRKLATSARHKTYSLSSLERRVEREIKFRNVTPLDIRRLVKAIREAAKEK
jgi:DNA protecting protein DprA